MGEREGSGQVRCGCSSFSVRCKLDGECENNMCLGTSSSVKISCQQRPLHFEITQW